jgi:hypothetical protein
VRGQLTIWLKGYVAEPPLVPSNPVPIDVDTWSPDAGATRPDAVGIGALVYEVHGAVMAEARQLHSACGAKIAIK